MNLCASKAVKTKIICLINSIREIGLRLRGRRISVTASASMRCFDVSGFFINSLSSSLPPFPLYFSFSLWCMNATPIYAREGSIRLIFLSNYAWHCVYKSQTEETARVLSAFVLYNTSSRHNRKTQHSENCNLSQTNTTNTTQTFVVHALFNIVLIKDDRRSGQNVSLKRMQYSFRHILLRVYTKPNKRAERV